MRALASGIRDKVAGELEDLVRKKSAEQDPKHRIHIAWICIAEDSRRVEGADIKLHQMLAEHMPVLVVITKARNDDGFEAIVRNLLPEAKDVVRVRALPEIFDDGHMMPPMGLESLVEATAELIPEAFEWAWASAQKVNLDEKKKAARKAVMKAAAAATAVGATPIPAADAVALVPIQITMLVKTSKIFGIDPSPGLPAHAGRGGGRDGGNYPIVAEIGKSVITRIKPGAGSGRKSVIPAKAGIHLNHESPWIPAFAGMTG